MSYDLIVIGMGPAGSVAAYEAASRGLRVIGLDRSRFPRYKTCGGGLSPKILKLIRIENEPFLEQTVHTLRLSFLSRSKTFQFADPISYMVMRETFDNMLVDRAVTAGADFRPDTPVRKIEEKREEIIVHTDRHAFSGKLAVGADGALGISTRQLNPGLPLIRSPGIEGEFRTAPPFGNSTIEIEVGHTPSGYGWIFPKRERSSIGVAGFLGKRPVRHPYASYLRSIFNGALPPKQETGHPIPLFSDERLKLASGRLLLAGDAGHLVDPFFGEGIYYAMRSGEIAGAFAKQFLDGKARPCQYQKWIEREFYPEFRGARRLASIVYRFPETFFNLTLKYPGVIRMYMEVISGRRPYRSFLYRILGTALRRAIRI
jgi:geranylgeranyl reductase family protein